MIENLLKLSLNNRTLVLGMAAALLVTGFFRASTMPVDVFPDLTAPRVTVVTESTGMAAEEVEPLITFPLETAISGTSGLRRVRSASAPGISIVWAEFDWDTDPVVARQRITERLQSVGATLPPTASTPILAPASSVMGEIAFVAVTSETLTPIQLRRIAEVDVRRRLLAVEGVAQIVPIGGAVKQYQILADPNRLQAFKLTLEDVVNAVSRGSRNSPGGYLVTGGQESVVRVLGRANSVHDLKHVVIAQRDTVPVNVGDVAEVVVGHAVLRGAAGYRGQPAVLLSIAKQPQADTLSTTRHLDEVLGELETSLKSQHVNLHRDIFRQQDFIDMAVDNLLNVLQDGAILVVLVLALFLFSLRPTLISVLSIPLSLTAAMLTLNWLGLGIDTMTLGGLAIAIGELVDDAIVDVENVMRRLRERSALPMNQRSSVIDTVLSASMEVRPTIVSATVILMLVFVPLLLLGGMEGRLLQPLAIAYLVAIFASLIVAVTVTPVLCSLLLAQNHESGSGQTQGEPPVIAFILRGYGWALTPALRHPWAIIGIALGVLVAGGYGMGQAGRSFLPTFNEGSLTINMALTPGTSLEDSDALARVAELALMADPGVVSVGRRTGRAERDEHVLGPETSEFEVRIRPDDHRTRTQLFADIRERLAGVPGGHFTLGQPISHRIEHMVSGQRSALSIKVVGESLRELQKTAAQVRDIAGTVPGWVDVNVEQMAEIPHVHAQIRQSAAATYGFSTGAATHAISTALWGATANHVYESGTVTDVVVKYPPNNLKSLEKLKSTLVPTPSGALAPLGALADVVRDTGPNYILRDDVRRRVVVTANLDTDNQHQALADLQGKLKRNLPIPAGVHLEFAGQFERDEALSSRLQWLGLLSIVAIALVVFTTLQSARRTAIVLTNLPLALAGGVVGVFAAGGVLSVATTIGFITLFGIATRNGLLLTTRASDLERQGTPWPEAVRTGAAERLSPILMTAITAALGLLPLGLSLGQPGSEIQAPMALVILTGLITSTLLNMFVVPTLLMRFGK